MDTHNPFFMFFFMYFVLRMNRNDIFHQSAKVVRRRLVNMSHTLISNLISNFFTSSRHVISVTLQPDAQNYHIGFIGLVSLFELL